MNVSDIPKKVITDEEHEKEWQDTVEQFINLANNLNMAKGRDAQLVSTALLFASMHYGVFEIASGGTLPKDILVSTTNNAYGFLVKTVEHNIKHLIPPDEGKNA